MSEATLKFELPDQEIEFRLAMNGGAYYAAIHELSQILRRERKYNCELSEIELDLVERLEQEFYEILNDRGITLDEVH